MTGPEELERRFGDPWDAGNPAGFAAILAADERAGVPQAGEAILDEYGLGAEFVPPAYGGRLTRVDRLVDIMRTVYRRDPALGLGYGVSSFIAAVNVWAAGDEEQRRAVAGLLLGGRRVASVYHELAHGNDLAGMEFVARPDGDALVLSGRKEVITNVRRADALVVFARTGPGRGSRQHSQVYVDKALVPEGRVGYLPRFASAGMRGVQLGGVEFRDYRAPASAVIGEPGRGLETALRSFQLTRTALPAMAVGVVDSGLRTALRGALDRRLYGRSVADLPHLRSVLAEAYADLLACDAFCRVAARALHLLPGQTAVYAPAVKYLVPGVLSAAMRRLSHVLGARFYVREGPYGIFQKHLRDLAPAGFGHIARAACLATLLPQLPRLARRGWPEEDAAGPELFRVHDDLPPLAYDRLRVTTDGRDGLGAAHPVALKQIGAEAAALPPRDLTMMAAPAAYDLVARYTQALAASACLGVRRHAGGGDPAWVDAALHRLAAPPGHDPPPLPEEVERRLFAELLDRYESCRSFDLAARPLPG